MGCILNVGFNLRRLGYSGYARCNIKVSSKSWVKDVFESLIKIPNIIAALKLIGPYNINVLAPFSSPEQLMKTHASISAIPALKGLTKRLVIPFMFGQHTRRNDFSKIAMITTMITSDLSQLTILSFGNVC